MNLDELSDQQLVSLGKEVLSKIAERIEANKSKTLEWGSKFKDKIELVYNYLDEVPRSLQEIVKELAIHLSERQVLLILKDLVDSKKVVENGSNYCRR